MEKCVEKLEAMFQKADSDINCLSQKLKQEFENNENTPVNPTELMSKLQEAKREHLHIVQQANAIREQQKEAVKEFSSNLNDVCELLLKIQTTPGLELSEKPEELVRLEKFLGQEFAWGQSSPNRESGSDDKGVTGAEDSVYSPSTSVDAVSPSQRRSSSEFVEVSEQEFESVSPTVRGNVTLADVNNTYRILWRHFKENKKCKSLTPSEMYKMGLRVTGKTGQAKLKVLKSLKLLSLTPKGDVSVFQN